MRRPIIERIRDAVLHAEHGYLWDERVSDPDTWSDEQMDSAEAVVSTVLQILDAFEKAEAEKDELERQRDDEAVRRSNARWGIPS